MWFFLYFSSKIFFKICFKRFFFKFCLQIFFLSKRNCLNLLKRRQHSRTPHSFTIFKSFNVGHGTIKFLDVSFTFLLFSSRIWRNLWRFTTKSALMKFSKKGNSVARWVTRPCRAFAKIIDLRLSFPPSALPFVVPPFLALPFTDCAQSGKKKTVLTSKVIDKRTCFANKHCPFDAFFSCQLCC